MDGTLHLEVTTISGNKIEGDKNDFGEESQETVESGIGQLASMIKDSNLTYLTLQVKGISIIVRAHDISTVALVGSTDEINELIWKVV